MVLRPIIQTSSLNSSVNCLRYSQCTILDFYNNIGETQIYFALDQNRPQSGIILTQRVQFLGYAVLAGRRITPLSQNLRQTAGSSLVCMDWDGGVISGEVKTIYHHQQAGFPRAEMFAEVQWMKESEYFPVDSNPWVDL